MTKRPRWTGCWRWVPAGSDVGQGEQPWVVLADPEGNEFCVLAPRGSQPPGTELVASVS